MNILKKITTLLLASILFTGFTQTKDRKLALGAIGGVRNYRGDLGNGFFNTKKDNLSFYGGLFFNQYINKSFNTGIAINYGNVSYKNDKNTFLPSKSGLLDVSKVGFKGEFLDYNVNLKYKFNNGYLLKEDATFGPFAGLGLGVAHGLNIKTTLANGTSFKHRDLVQMNIPATAGVSIKISPRFYALAQISYNFLETDKLDSIRTSERKKHDKILSYGIGISYTLGKEKDTDKDGVADKVDKCNDTRPNIKVNTLGCDLDTDGDGIADADDVCLNEKGTINGCPDTDEDGIKDSEDKCPNERGILTFMGCADTDGDGIQDSEDVCPTTKGITAFKGCPDTDGDGIKDAEDKCPTAKGLPNYAGCPDTDGDGVIDIKDKCPKITGLASNNGCPEVNKEIAIKAAKSAKAINFETGSDVILKTSYKDLDNLASILKSEFNLKAEIQGHTDNTGNVDKNKALSQKRADAVKKYLIEKGIEQTRLTAIGYGQEIPLQDNKTVSGRNANRRVEFKLNY